MNSVVVNVKLGGLCLAAAIVAAITGWLLPDEFVLVLAATDFVDFVQRQVPIIGVVSEHFSDQRRAVLTWSIQWAFVPLHFLVLVLRAPPRSPAFVEAARLKISSFSRPKAAFALLTALVFVAIVILSDIGVVDFYSLYRGSPFVVSGDLAAAPILLRAPHTSVFGMVVYAWAVPAAVTFMYYFFLLFFVSVIPLYVARILGVEKSSA
ncbi:MAG: hypothetical protein ACOY33_07910 [Pseudomonadota bacterium]